jgi:sec-independent protein translocase protein TatB
VKAEIKEELRAEEMRQLFNEQQADISEFQTMLDEATHEVNSIQSSLKESVEDRVIEVNEPHESK